MKLFSINSNYLNKISSLYSFKRLIWFIILIGIVLRLNQYLYNRTLWLDEAFLVHNIVKKSFSQFLQPLYYKQAAPFLFLVFEKISLILFSKSEYSFRLLPFLSGIISLFLYYKLTKQTLKKKALLIALFAFSISDKLIYYSAEVKQYSTDVTITILLLISAIYIQSKESNIPRTVFFTVIGVIAIWFSQPSVIVLFGLGSCLIVFDIIKKRWRRVITFFIVYLFWGASFITYYLISLHKLVYVSALQKYWQFAFMPLELTSKLSDWFFVRFIDLQNNPAGFTFTGIAALAFIIGCYSFFKRDRELFFILLSPLIATIIVSSFHKYPFFGRLILFLLPIVYIFIAEGVFQIIEKTKINYRIIGVLLIILLFYDPTNTALTHFQRPYCRDDIKPLMKYLRTNWKDGDVLYLYSGSTLLFLYYAKDYGFKNDDFINGVFERNNLNEYIKDIDKLRGINRVWLLFTHIYKKNGIDEEKFFLWHLNNIGKKLDEHFSTESSVFLYDLSNKQLTKKPKINIKLNWKKNN